MNTPEDAFVRSIVKHLDSLSFQPHAVGFSILDMNPVIAERLAETIVYIASAWDNSYINDLREVPFSVAEFGHYLTIGIEMWKQYGSHHAGILISGVNDHA